MTDHIMQILQSVGIVILGVMALVSTLKCEQARQEAREARATVAALQDSEPACADPELTGIDPHDIFRYAALLRVVLEVVKGIGRLGVGQKMPVPRVVLDLPNGEQISLAPTTATRER